MKNNKYTKALIILIAICYSTFLFGCNSKTDYTVYPDGHAYADGTDTAEEGHHHHHDDEDEHDEHDEHHDEHDDDDHHD
ncbi:MAG: hypothetical protein II567_00555 [Candidatus Riflebacteria bacterium]|nr:hypothetical protein [Candidatus Riflebacteria bacterium]